MWIESTQGKTTVWRWRKSAQHLFSRATVTHHPVSGYRWRGGIQSGEAATLAEAQEQALLHKNAQAKAVAAARAKSKPVRIPALDALLRLDQ